MPPLPVGVLCAVTLVTAVASLPDAGTEPSQAIRAGTAASSPVRSASPADDALREPAAPAGALSLGALAREAQARATTSTTRAGAVAGRASATTTTAPTVVTTTTRPVSPASPTTTTPLTPLTTLLQKVSPPAAAVAGKLTTSDSGVASWFDAPSATCAHRTLPMGTMVKVTRTATGATATCRVNDRGPTLATGRVIDLSLDTFQKLAAKEAGLVDVTIEW